MWKGKKREDPMADENIDDFLKTPDKKKSKKSCKVVDSGKKPH